MAVLNRVLYARNERPEQVGRAKFLVAAAGKLRQPGSPRQIITPICGTTGEYFRQPLISWARGKVVAEHPGAPGTGCRVPTEECWQRMAVSITNLLDM